MKNETREESKDVEEQRNESYENEKRERQTHLLQLLPSPLLHLLPLPRRAPHPHLRPKPPRAPPSSRPRNRGGGVQIQSIKAHSRHGPRRVPRVRTLTRRVVCPLLLVMLVVVVRVGESPKRSDVVPIRIIAPAQRARQARKGRRTRLAARRRLLLLRE